jgi:hypothetical protein
MINRCLQEDPLLRLKIVQLEGEVFHHLIKEYCVER